jgi:hypothetical protein
MVGLFRFLTLFLVLYQGFWILSKRFCFVNNQPICKKNHTPISYHGNEACNGVDIVVIKASDTTAIALYSPPILLQAASLLVSVLT